MKKQKNIKKAVLAFSGGLDTSFCVLYLKEQGYDVVTMTVDTGGFTKEDQDYIAKQSKLVGALKHYFIDGKKQLYDQIVSYIIKGNVLRGGVYPLSAGPERLIIATNLVKIAKKEKAVAVIHGSTGAGNDQVRFDVAIKVLAPELKIIAPIRDLELTREKEIKILEKKGISIPTISKSYSINKGMLGITIGGKETKGSWESPPEEVYPDITPLVNTPDKSETFILSYKNGLPVGINGKFMDGLSILKYLTEIGGKHGIGKNIHLGNTILGIKGRVAFAAPAITVLIKAHKELEKLVLTKWQSFWKDTLSEVWGNFVHEGLYFDPVIKDIEAMLDSSQKCVTGEVKVKLFKGNIIIEGYKSAYSLMDTKIATYGEENLLWTGKEAVGFCKIYGLQSILAHKAYKLGKKYEKNQVH
ncbi:argininosuccinate synthase [Candidatus Roizmanbacteria bacterium CG2_30_33_16]|uniref:argininosuccinate synthase n=3 Tax=Candidatus Roizmaniibacteriota TaxID=1752723 RepID=A0A2H0C4N0_9BACT|nr:argininosuccinate synthase [Candidatus Roizmanbacteria bacterium]OIP83200.1 MAG: argininosuccinate synthase [Candidatus Roizmanbacteria bacterium CG2_30_33_16]PIP64877.1 MAG: argininosuccinate synthase [Candidatus Roizmanbacteria bacterium CG22_combo_CG10-13_8_21_14_all_33_16]PIX72168.1 MAG: argininosuccinate synthase [Candidatus Roizmanbacteria bacterium CG_4_10_14_3_um_filter_33_21]